MIVVNDISRQCILNINTRLDTASDQIGGCPGAVMVVVGPTSPWLHLSPSWTLAPSSAVGLLAEGNLSQFMKTNWGNNAIKYDVIWRVQLLSVQPRPRESEYSPRDPGPELASWWWWGQVQMLGGVLCLHYDYDGQPRYPAVAGTGQLANKRRQFTGGHFSFTHFKYLVSQKTFKL